jgi:hypothetical protein
MSHKYIGVNTFSIVQHDTTKTTTLLVGQLNNERFHFTHDLACDTIVFVENPLT